MKAIIRDILSIILAVAIIIFYFINLASSTVLNEQYVLSKLEKEDYYEKMYNEINSNFEKYIHQSGLDENVLENIISNEKVKKDTVIILGNIYDGISQKIDTEEIRENLNNNIEKNIGKENITPALKISIDNFIEHICNEYKTTISHFSFENDIHRNYTKIMDYINLSKKVLLIAIGIDFLLLIMINLKKIYKLVSQVGISFTITGISLLIVNIFINTKIKIQTITILNDAISEALRKILTENLSLTFKYGIITLILGIVMIILPNLIHNFKKYGKLKEIDVDDETKKIKNK